MRSWGRLKSREFEYKCTKTGIAVAPDEMINEVGVVLRTEEGDMKFEIKRRKCASTPYSALTSSKVSIVGK
jgi:hypothetical protein